MSAIDPVCTGTKPALTGLFLPPRYVFLYGALVGQGRPLVTIQTTWVGSSYLVERSPSLAVLGLPTSACSAVRSAPAEALDDGISGEHLV